MTRIAEITNRLTFNRGLAAAPFALSLLLGACGSPADLDSQSIASADSELSGGGIVCDKPGGPRGVVLRIAVPIRVTPPVAPPIGPQTGSASESTVDLGISSSAFDILSVTQSAAEGKRPPVRVVPLNSGNWGVSSGDGAPFAKDTRFNVAFAEHIETDPKKELEACSAPGGDPGEGVPPGDPIRFAAELKHVTSKQDTLGFESCFAAPAFADELASEATFIRAHSVDPQLASTSTLDTRLPGKSTVCLVNRSGKSLPVGAEIVVQFWTAD